MGQLCVDSLFAEKWSVIDEHRTSGMPAMVVSIEPGQNRLTLGSPKHRIAVAIRNHSHSHVRTSIMHLKLLPFSVNHQISEIQFVTHPLLQTYARTAHPNCLPCNANAHEHDHLLPLRSEYSH